MLTEGTPSPAEEIKKKPHTWGSPRPDRYLKKILCEHLDEYRFETMPESLAAAAGVHPRLYLNQTLIEDLRRKILSEPYYAWMFEGVQHVADVASRNGPTKYHLRGGKNEEQTWQRQTGNLIPYLAFTYLLTRDQTYLAAAAHTITTSLDYESWGKGAFAGTDLATGHQLYGLALAYDWLYDDLDEGLRGRVSEALLDRAGYMFKRFTDGTIFWHDEYLQNHQWVNMTAMATVGLALFDEVEGLDPWIVLPLEKFKLVMASLGSDGASHEGVSYWSYGTEYLMKFMDLARELLDVDMYGGNEWFANTAYYRIYSSLPIEHVGRRATSISFGDSHRRDTYGPDYHLRKLASHYRIGQAQWLADRLEKAGACTRKASWLNLLWYDPTVEPVDLKALPTFRHFEDIGIVFMRSDFDGGESMSMFKCGPHIGRHGIERFDYDPGGSHAHPDAGELQIYAHGDWLLINDGYTYKQTALQNTVTIDGVGQIDEDSSWYVSDALCRDDRGGRILLARPGRQYDYIIGDATSAYRDEAGLRKFLRHVLYLKPDCWVIFDELEADRPVRFDAFYHTSKPMQQVGPGHFVVEKNHGAMDLRVLAPVGFEARPIKQKMYHPDACRYIGDLDALNVANETKAAEVVFVVVLEARAADCDSGVEAHLQTTEAGMVLSVRTPERTWRLAVGPGRTDPRTPIFDLME